MTPALENRLLGLIADLRDKVAQAPDADAFLGALERGDFYFEREPWFPAWSGPHNKSHPGEMLIRAQNLRGEPLSPANPIKAIYEHDLHKPFDTFIAVAAIHQAVETNALPVSINVSSRHAEDEAFWLDLHNDIQRHFGDKISPRQIIFEFLEDACPGDIASGTLSLMQDIGYRFALDDAIDSTDDYPRQDALLPYCNFAKVAGTVVEAAHEDRGRLCALCVRLSERMGDDGQLVLENIKTFSEAERLSFDTSSSGYAQGRYLTTEKAFLRPGIR